MTVGVGWRRAAEEAQRRLRDRHRDARARIGEGDFAIARAGVDAPAQERQVRRAVIADVQREAMRIGELHGASGSVRAGVVVSVRFEPCRQRQRTG